MYCWHFAWFGISTLSLAISEICLTVLRDDRISMYSYQFYGWKLFLTIFYLCFICQILHIKKVVCTEFGWLWMKLLTQSNRSGTRNTSPKYRRHHFTGRNKGRVVFESSCFSVPPHPGTIIIQRLILIINALPITQDYH